jgi:hypothetical protein
LRDRSLRHQYDEEVDEAVELYKESLPRNAILSIGDEAVAAIRQQTQLGLTELLLYEEVNRIIKRRLGIKDYPAWRRRTLRLLKEYRRAEHWGLRPESPLVREIQPDQGSHVLLAGDTAERAALYLAANGCEVTTVELSSDAMERVMTAAGKAGLMSRVHEWPTGIGHWRPDCALNAVVCTPSAFAGLTPAEVSKVIALFQEATMDGGVHLVETIVAGQDAMSLADLRARYAGWDISVERDGSTSRSFVARKGAA